MNKAVEALDHFPSIAELENIAQSLGIKHGTGWKYKTERLCNVCGGGGWHFAFRPDGGEGVVACDCCDAGRNMQQGPRGTITWTMKSSGSTYSRPGQFAEGEYKPKVQGNPASVECMCEKIEKGETEDRAFRWAMENYFKIPEDTMWEIFEYWKRGELHPVTIKNRERWNKPPVAG